MAITNRNLEPGTRLEAKYKGIARFCTVLEDGTYKLDGDQDLGKTYKSPSAAGSAIMGGVACNGWRFWSIAGEATTATAANTAETKPKRSRPPTAAATPKVRAPRAAVSIEMEPEPETETAIA